MDTIEYKARSLMFCDVNGEAYLSICTDDGNHLRLEVSPSQCALISQEVAKFVAVKFAQASREAFVSKLPALAPFTDDVRPEQR